jgi:hypothetical protein
MMNESKYSAAKLTRLAIVVTALLATLVVVQALNARPAEAGACLTTICQQGPGTTYTYHSNNSFAYADDAYYGSGFFTGNTNGFSLEPGEPKPYSATKDCGISGIYNSAWFRISVPMSAKIKVSTEGSSFDTVLGLYKGSSLTSLQQLNCSNDNSSPNWTDNMIQEVPAGGQTYYLQLSGTGGLRSGNYKLLVNLVQ